MTDWAAEAVTRGDEEPDPVEDARKFWRDIDAKSDAIDSDLARLIKPTTSGEDES